MDKYDLESVLRKGAELVKRKGIKCLVIDPYNKVRDVNAVSDDVNRYTMDYLMKIEAFAKKYDALVFIVAHPTKMMKNDKGQISEPNMYNIKGGGEWYDASYHGLLVHRDYEAKNTKVKVLKVKFQNKNIDDILNMTIEDASNFFIKPLLINCSTIFSPRPSIFMASFEQKC